MQTTKYKKGVVVFGSHVLGVIPGQTYGNRIYKNTEAYIKRICKHDPEIVIITGGGSGLMEAANKGAKASGALSLGFPIRGLIDTIISDGEEEQPNAYLDNSVICDTFEERKQHIMYIGTVYIVLPGGYGTLDELFEIVTLAQTKKRTDIHKIILMDDHGEFWRKVFNLQLLVDAGTVCPSNLDLIQYSTFLKPIKLFN